jgi:hypothetical protein
MRLDTAAIHALNVLPNPKEPNQNKNLFGLLNKVGGNFQEKFKFYSSAKRQWDHVY